MLPERDTGVGLGRAECSALYMQVLRLFSI
jgi:hypothetical protein